MDKDELLAEDDEDQIQEQEEETNDVQNVMTNLSKSLQIMAGSMQAMEVSLKRLHSPVSTATDPPKKRAPIVDVNENNPFQCRSGLDYGTAMTHCCQI